MILLEVQNRILYDTVLAQLNWSGEEKRDPIDVRVCDFDDVSYRLTIEAENRDVLLVSMASAGVGQNMEKGSADMIKEIYSDLKAPQAVAGYDLTLQIDMTKTKGKEEDIARRVSMLKPNVVGGVFHYFTKKLKNDEVEPPYRFQLRGDTTVYVFPAKDRVVFIYSMHFDDKAENCIAKVFMQEFVDAKKKIERRHQYLLALCRPVSFKSRWTSRRQTSIWAMYHLPSSRHTARTRSFVTESANNCRLSALTHNITLSVPNHTFTRGCARERQTS
jgi:actin related protein 2/3 complex subunit 2